MDHAENTAYIVKEACLLICYLAMDVLLLRALAPVGMCLRSRCLAMGLYVTVLIKKNKIIYKVSLGHSVKIILSDLSGSPSPTP
jgi:hypothetical protein